MEEIPSHRADPREGRDSFDLFLCPTHSFLEVLGPKCPMPSAKYQIWPLSGSLSSLSLMSEDVLPPSSFNRLDRTNAAVSLGASVCCAPRVLSPCFVNWFTFVARELSLAHSH